MCKKHKQKWSINLNRQSTIDWHKWLKTRKLFSGGKTSNCHLLVCCYMSPFSLFICCSYTPFDNNPTKNTQHTVLQKQERPLPRKGAKKDKMIGKGCHEPTISSNIIVWKHDLKVQKDPFWMTTGSRQLQVKRQCKKRCHGGLKWLKAYWIQNLVGVILFLDVCIYIYVCIYRKYI